MAITGKELAREYFQEAVDLEAIKRALSAYGLEQDFNKVFTLYKRAIELDSNNADAMNNLACLYLEHPSKDMDEIENNRVIAKKYYDKASKLGNRAAKYNLHLLDMVILSDLAEDFKFHARSYEKGIPNPEQAIEMYKQARDTYDGLIQLLMAELARINAIKGSSSTQFIQYKNMLAYNQQLAEKDRARLQNMQHRNELYLQGLRCEKMISGDDKPDYTGAIKEYKKAAALGHVAAGILHDYLLCRDEKTKDAIALCEQAIALGHTGAMFRRAYLYAQGHGNNGIPQYDKAIELYKRADGLGDTRAKIEIDRLAQELLNIAQKLCAKKDEMSHDVQLDGEINKLCLTMKKLADLYQKGWGNNGVAESEKAEKLCLQAENLKNLYDRKSLNKENKQNDGTELPQQPVQKKPRTMNGMKHLGPIIDIRELRKSVESSAGVPAQSSVTADNIFSMFPSSGFKPSILRSGPTTPVVSNHISIRATNS